MDPSNFWKRTFSDLGEPSFSRVATGFVLAFACGWVTAIVHKTHSLPEFGGLTLFVTCLYGANLAKSVMNRRTDAAVAVTPDPDKPQ